MNILWSVINAFILFTAASACIEIPKRRSNERFTVNLSAEIAWRSGHITGCTVDNISLGGAQLTLPLPAEDSFESGTLIFPSGDLRIPFNIIRRETSTYSVCFELESELRHRLMVKLFTGDFDNEVETISPLRVLFAVCKVLFA
jgi:hypothetical protein